jgi:hypothetical protein|nr:MAG TPA: hypothetical protein [Caudoviricetes sp.]
MISSRNLIYTNILDLTQLGFDDVQENGIQTPIYKSVQNNRGEIIDRDFVGFKKIPLYLRWTPQSGRYARYRLSLA